VSPRDLKPSLLASSPKKDSESTQGVSGVLRNLGEVDVVVGEGDPACIIIAEDVGVTVVVEASEGLLSLRRGVVVGDPPEGEKVPGGKASNETPSFEEDVNRISGNSMPEKSTTTPPPSLVGVVVVVVVVVLSPPIVGFFAGESSCVAEAEMLEAAPSNSSWEC